MFVDFSKMQEERFLKSKMDTLVLENEELRNMTESLTRRIRILSDYNSTGINNIIASKVEKENCNFLSNKFNNLFLPLNKDDCICGGKNIMALFCNENPLPQTNLLPETIEKPPETVVEFEISEKNEKSLTNEDTNKNNSNSLAMEIEVTTKEENASSGISNIKIQLELLEKQNTDLIKEKANLKKDIENLNLFKVIKTINILNFALKLLNYFKKHSNKIFFLIYRIIMKKLFLNQKPLLILCNKVKSS